eukprot:scaffold108689_cov19-Prasinocladus_malaysianus.AAC.1
MAHPSVKSRRPCSMSAIQSVRRRPMAVSPNRGWCHLSPSALRYSQRRTRLTQRCRQFQVARLARLVSLVLQVP